MSDLHLYVYDLSKGLAKQLSAMFLGPLLANPFKSHFVLKR